jgi:hypothetical protein
VTRRRKGLNADRWKDYFAIRVQPVDIKAKTGYDGSGWEGIVLPLRPWRYYVTDLTVSGAAPKNFIHVYDHRSPNRTYPPSWPAYIAKVGHKWYPAESFTEQLMTRIGETLGLRMAKSRLMLCEGQIRFLSRYFLNPADESLVHGADILGGYLSDLKFVTKVGEEKLERDLFTFRVCCDAIHAIFPQDEDDIVIDFVRMIGFDALVGNQDRHLLNWGVIVHSAGKRRPRFSPIYDTARGLFWNEAEDKLAKFDSDQSLHAYCEHARPLIGWEGETKINHFSLVMSLAAHNQRFCDALSRLCSMNDLKRVQNVVESEFATLFSEPRRRLICRCLALRFRLYADAVGIDLC